MGIFFEAKHQDDTTLVECGYISYGGYRMSVADAIDPLFGMMYRGFYFHAGEEQDERGRTICTWCVGGSVDVPHDPEAREWWQNRNLKSFEKELEQKYRDTPMRNFKVYCANANNSEDGAFDFGVRFDLDWDGFGEWVDEHLNEIQQNLLFAPDTEGKWSWQECRELYREFKDLPVEFKYRQSYDHEEDMHQMFLASWKKCAEDRVQMRWS